MSWSTSNRKTEAGPKKLPHCPKDTALIPDCVFGKSYSPKACIKKMKKWEKQNEKHLAI